MPVDPWHLVWLIVSAMCAAVAVLYVGTSFLGLFVGNSGALHRWRTRRERTRAGAEVEAMTRHRKDDSSATTAEERRAR
jgi:hypothetical protein